MLNLGLVLETLSDYRPTGREAAIGEVVIDSRAATPGSLFIAFKGEQADGHAYIGEAFERGAALALAQRDVSGPFARLDARRSVTDQLEAGDLPAGPICLRVEDTLAALQKLAGAWRDRFPDVRVIGITGSVGKTTTKELIASVLERRFQTLKSAGNLNNEIGLPLTLLKLRPWHRRAVLEMGMYAEGEIRLLCELARPQVGVVTLVGAVHMERLGSIEAIAAAKRELIEALPPAPEGVAVLNRDDPLVMAMAEHTQARIVTYGLEEGADLWADQISSMGLEGIRFRLHYGSEVIQVQAPLLGRHSVQTALRATAIGLLEGLSWDEIIAGLHGLSSQLRLVVSSGPKSSIILDDTYNSSPESAVAALNLLADLNGRRIAVLGDMLELGPVEEESHRLVGRRAREVADVLVAVGELGHLIGDEAREAGMAADDVLYATDSESAAALLREMIRPADVILIKASRGARLDRLVSALEAG